MSRRALRSRVVVVGSALVLGAALVAVPSVLAPPSVPAAPSGSESPSSETSEDATDGTGDGARYTVEPPASAPATGGEDAASDPDSETGGDPGETDLGADTSAGDDAPETGSTTGDDSAGDDTTADGSTADRGADDSAHDDGGVPDPETTDPETIDPGTTGPGESATPDTGSGPGGSTDDSTDSSTDSSTDASVGADADDTVTGDDTDNTDNTDDDTTAPGEGDSEDQAAPITPVLVQAMSVPQGNDIPITVTSSTGGPLAGSYTVVISRNEVPLESRSFTATGSSASQSVAFDQLPRDTYSATVRWEGGVKSTRFEVFAARDNQAVQPTSSAGTVALSSSTVAPGEDITFALSGFPASTAVQISSQPPAFATTIRTDPQGRHTLTRTLPAPGTYTIAFLANDGGSTAAATVTVEAPGSRQPSREVAGQQIPAPPAIAPPNAAPSNAAPSNTAPSGTAAPAPSHRPADPNAQLRGLMVGIADFLPAESGDDPEDVDTDSMTELPRTGGDLAALPWALGFLAAGAGLVLHSRRAVRRL